MDDPTKLQLRLGRFLLLSAPDFMVPILTFLVPTSDLMVLDPHLSYRLVPSADPLLHAPDLLEAVPDLLVVVPDLQVPCNDFLLTAFDLRP